MSTKLIPPEALLLQNSFNEKLILLDSCNNDVKHFCNSYTLKEIKCNEALTNEYIRINEVFDKALDDYKKAKLTYCNAMGLI